jgi:hypothetical protein
MFGGKCRVLSCSVPLLRSFDHRPYRLRVERPLALVEVTGFSSALTRNQVELMDTVVAPAG